MEYMRLILEMFWDLQEKGFMPEGVNYERFMEIIDQKAVDLDENIMIWEMAVDMITESAFFGFLTGFNYSRILSMGEGRLTFPQPDDYQKIINQIKEENKGGNNNGIFEINA